MLKFLRWVGVLDDPGTLHLDGAVLARAYPRKQHLSPLVNRGVRVLINLHPRPHSPALLARHGLRQVHLPVRDYDAPSLEQVELGLETLKQAEGLVLIHCGGGYGRTGTLLACLYLARGLTLEAAIARVRRERPGAIESHRQIAMIKAYAAKLKA